MRNTVQNYAWGSSTGIPNVTGMENREGVPMAELWMGAHPRSSSLVKTNGQWLPLVSLITEDPRYFLGEYAAEKFGAQLPFLFKILSAAQPLSIQAHPNLEQAREGYRRENDEGIPLDAEVRNYKDQNHKPELIHPLTEFWALRGFRPLTELAEEFGEAAFPVLGDAAAFLNLGEPEGLRRFFSTLMTLSRHDTRELVRQAVAFAARKRPAGRAHESCGPEAYAAPRYYWVVETSRTFPDDIGIVAPLYLNCLHLQPGEGMYLGAGVLHAYLLGTGIEIMANSDNVLRGGCTVKHVDVPELLSVLHFAGETPVLMSPTAVLSEQACREDRFHTPCEEFELSRLTLNAEPGHNVCRSDSPEILLCIDGEIRLTEGGSEVTIRRGESYFVPAGVPSYVMSGTGLLFRAGVPAGDRSA